MAGWDTLACVVWMLEAVAAQHHTASVSTPDDSYRSLNSLPGLFETWGERSSEAKAGLSSIELYLQARWDIS